MTWACEAYSGCPCPNCVDSDEVTELLELWIQRAKQEGIIVHCGGCEGHCDNSAEVRKEK